MKNVMLSVYNIKMWMTMFLSNGTKSTVMR